MAPCDRINGKLCGKGDIVSWHAAWPARSELERIDVEGPARARRPRVREPAPPVAQEALQLRAGCRLHEELGALAAGAARQRRGDRIVQRDRRGEPSSQL